MNRILNTAFNGKNKYFIEDRFKYYYLKVIK
jgi:hypothetical protein